MLNGDRVPVQELVLDILCVMAMHDVKSQNIIRDSKGLAAILTMIKSPNVEIRRRAVRALGAVCQGNRKIQQYVRKCKAIPIVTEQLSDDNQECRKSAASCIAAVAENDFANQTDFRKFGAVNGLVNILQGDDDDETKEQAAAAIRSLAKGNIKIQGDFRDGPGIPMLCHHLCSSSVGLRINATGALMELARDNTKNADIVCYAGACHPLVAALDTENQVLQYLSEGCIWALAKKSSKRRAMFRDANAIEPLRILKTSDNPQVKKGAEWALEALGG